MITEMKDFIKDMFNVDDLTANNYYVDAVNMLDDNRRFVWLALYHSSKEDYDSMLYNYSIPNLPEIEIGIKYTKASLAREIGCSPSNIYRYECDAHTKILFKYVHMIHAEHSKVPDLKRTIQLCDGLDERVKSILIRSTTKRINGKARHLTIEELIELPYPSKYYRNLGAKAFNDLDTYFTYKLGDVWKESPMYKALSNDFVKYRPMNRETASSIRDWKSDDVIEITINSEKISMTVEAFAKKIAKFIK